MALRFRPSKSQLDKSTDRRRDKATRIGALPFNAIKPKVSIRPKSNCFVEAVVFMQPLGRNLGFIVKLLLCRGLDSIISLHLSLFGHCE